MRPLNGVILDTIKSTNEIVIKTEIGMVLKIKNKHELKIGDKVAIYYDYTKNRIAKVLPATEEKLYNVKRTENIVPDIDVASLVLFGALLPGDDGCHGFGFGLESGPDALDPSVDGDLIVLLTEHGYAGAIREPKN